MKSNIEWTDYTHNHWFGCEGISPACYNCYAADWAKRYGKDFAKRTLTSETNRRKPLKWDTRPYVECMSCGWRGEASACNTVQNPAGFHPPIASAKVCPQCMEPLVRHARRRVFSDSLADWLDNKVPVEWLVDHLDLIRRTPNLDWLLLTKRIGNWQARLTAAHQYVVQTMGGGTSDQRDHPLWSLGLWIQDWLAGKAPANVWLGASICNQGEADRDVPKLLRVPAAVRFLSIEPMLGAIDIEKWLDPWTCSYCGFHGAERDTGPCMCSDCGVEAVYAPEIGSGRCPECGKDDGTSDDVGGTCPSCKSVRGWSRDYGFKFDNEKGLLHWVIAGGESGQHARPLHPDWVRSLRDQCAAAGVPFIFKQWGEWLPSDAVDQPIHRGEHRHLGGSWHAYKIGKKAAGRLLDGVTHDGYPEPQQ